MTTKIKYPPLIITLKIDDHTQGYFSVLRKKNYPAYANYIDAHITLFHKLPSDRDAVYEKLEEISNREVFTIQAVGIKNMENGVAFEISSTVLQTLHEDMQKSFSSSLIRKDRQKLWPHITVQNKVTANKASLLHQNLMKDFKAFDITATGFSCWLYQKGPWEHQRDFLFEKTC